MVAIMAILDDIISAIKSTIYRQQKLQYTLQKIF